MKGYTPQPGARISVKDAAGAVLYGQTAVDDTVTTSAVAPKGARRMGFFIDMDAVSDSDTVDVAFEWSPDKGTTWVEMPASANSQTQAGQAQMTAAGEAFEWYEIVSDPEFTRIRAVITIGGTGESMDFGQVYWFFDQYPGY